MKTKILGILMVFCIAQLSLVAVSTTSSSTSPTNMVVDFDNTALSSTLHAGDDGILNLVVSNTGGYRAENVELYLTGAQTLEGEKRFNVGTVDAGKSKTILVSLKISSQASTGLKSITVVIDYDGYLSDGARDNKRQTKWEVPITIQGSPNFEVELGKTTYYKDTLDELTISGFTRDGVDDLTATLSSTCITFMGSSRKYVGDLVQGQQYSVTYAIKPTAAGACEVTLSFLYTDDSGSTATDTATLGLNIEEAGVDFKVLNVSYLPTGPGENVKLNIALKNVGRAVSEDTSASIVLSEPFVPVDTTEKYVGSVSGGEVIEVGFDVSVGWDAEIQPYSIPLNISYKVGGSSYSVGKNIGLDVTGKVILEVINVDTSRGLQIEVANIGTRTAEGVKAILTTDGGGNKSSSAKEIPEDKNQGTRGRRMPQSTEGGTQHQAGGSQRLVEYKSDIKPTKQTTFTFDTSMSGPFTLTLEYSGPNNERISQTERLTAGSNSMLSSMSKYTKNSGGTNTSQYALYAIAVLIVLWVIIRKKRGDSILPGFLRRNKKA